MLRSIIASPAAVAEAALADSNTKARQVALQTALDGKWEAAHDLMRHLDLPPATLSADARLHVHHDSQCLLKGVCCCSRPGNESNQLADWLLSSMRSRLRKTFWSKPKQKSKAPGRVLFEQACIVLKFSQAVEPDQRQHPSVFFHVGYTNFSSWRMSFLQLFPVKDLSEVDLQRRTFVRLQVRHEDRMLSETLELDHISVRDHMDLSLPWKLTFMRLVGADQLVPPLQMQSGIVDVTAATGLPDMIVWQGSEEETRLRRQARPRVQRAGAQAKPRAKAATAARPADTLAQAAAAAQQNPFADAVWQASLAAEMGASDGDMIQDDAMQLGEEPAVGLEGRTDDDARALFSEDELISDSDASEDKS